MAESRIRTAETADAVAVSRLLPDLGYAAAPEDFVTRLLQIRTWPENEVFIAEVDGDVVGMCHVQGVPLIASEGYAEIQALVIGHAVQRTGLGRALLRHAVSWSRSLGYGRVRLRSGLHREGAHRFYEAQGFVRSKASYAFELVTR